MRTYPYWKEYHKGKMDYHYWFTILGLSKLRENGKLGFITTQYWPFADSASKLREYILENAIIEEMIFFGEVKIFEHAKGQHNMVFVLRKCSWDEKQKKKMQNRIKIVQVKCKNKDLPGDTIRKNLDFLTDHIEKYIDKPSYEDEYIKVFRSGVEQGELPEDGENWNDILVRRSYIKLFSKLEEEGEELENVCDIIRGVDSNADRLTKSKLSYVPEYKKEKYKIAKDDGIFMITEEELNSLDLPPTEMELIKPTYKNSDICPYYVDINEKKYLIYIRKDTQIDDYQKIKTHLKKFKEVLENRAQNRRSDSEKWYTLNWPRDESLLKSKKIVFPRWGKKIFGYQTGDFYESTDVRVIVPKTSTTENILYILGVLNSNLIKKWLTQKVQRKGYTSQSALLEIPIHRIDFDDSWEKEIHNKVVGKVEQIRDIMAQLADRKKYFTCNKITDLLETHSLPRLKIESVIRNMSQDNIFIVKDVTFPQNMMPFPGGEGKNKLCKTCVCHYNIRTHPELQIEDKSIDKHTFRLKKVYEPQKTLKDSSSTELKGKNNKSVIITGPAKLLSLLHDILPIWTNKSWDDIQENLLVPKTHRLFSSRQDEILQTVKTLKEKYLKLQKEIDEIIYELYSLTEAEINMLKELT